MTFLMSLLGSLMCGECFDFVYILGTGVLDIARDGVFRFYYAVILLQTYHSVPGDLIVTIILTCPSRATA